MDNNKQIDLIEQAMKNAYQEKQPQEIPAIWQGAVIAAVKREAQAESKEIERTEKTLLHISWIAAGIAAILVLVFGLFFSQSNDGSVENDLQKLYVDNSMTEMITVISQ